MKIKPSFFKKFSETLCENFLNSHINNITHVSKNSFLITFSKNRNEKMFFDLSGNDPFIGLINGDVSISTLLDATSDTLRKYLKNGYVINIEQLNGDRILQFTYKITDELYNNLTRYLILEFLPLRTNLIILNEDKVILFASNYKSLTSSRPILKGEIYSCPPKSFLNQDDVTSKEEYQTILSMSEHRFLCAIESRKKEKLKPLLSKIKSRIKNLNKTKIMLQNEINNGGNNEELKEFALNLLTFQDDEIELKKLKEQYKNIYDESKTLFENVDRIFKLYKKGKTKIEKNVININNINNDLNHLNLILSNVLYYTEDDLNDLYAEIGLDIRNNSSNKHRVKQKKALFSYIEYNGKKIYFGKSKEQNDYLTFKYSQPNYLVFHIASYHGAHVVSNCNEDDFDTINVCGEIALLLSNKVDGDVNYALRKYIKKGKEIGQIIYTKYKTIHIKNIKESTRTNLLLNQKPYQH